MNKVEVLSALRGVISLVVLPFAIRARMWFLTAGWVAGLIASVCLASGVALFLVGVIGMPLYLFWAIHTLYVTRKRRDQPYLVWRPKPEG